MNIVKEMTQGYGIARRNHYNLTYLVLATGALALGVSGCKKTAPLAPQPSPVVQVIAVEKKNVARSTTFIGKLGSPKNVEVRARAESFLEKILSVEGDEIKAGAPLFELDKKPFEEKLDAAKGMLAESKAAWLKAASIFPA